jgi:hypothetical protein
MGVCPDLPMYGACGPANLSAVSLGGRKAMQINPKQAYTKPQVRALGSLSAVTKSMMLGSLDDLTMGMHSMMMNPPMMM